MRASDVLDRLAVRYKAGQWVFLREVKVAAGWETTGVPFDDPLWGRGASRLDGFAFGCWPSTNFERHAFEVKVTRSDLYAELKNPDKRAPGMRLSNRFYFVLSPDVLFTADHDLIPAECGIMLAGARGIIEARRAPFRDTPQPPPSFYASAIRKATGWELTPRCDACRHPWRVHGPIRLSHLVDVRLSPHGPRAAPEPVLSTQLCPVSVRV